MTITRQMLDTTYVCWFRNKRNTEKAKQEILKRFSEEPDDIHHWTPDLLARGTQQPLWPLWLCSVTVWLKVRAYVAVGPEFTHCRLPHYPCKNMPHI